jgi:hypothetical protein
MALPKLDVPTYELELPISKKKIKYRPFLVKEQRNLFMALESSDSNSMQESIKDILYNCTLTEGIDFDKLPIVDIEYYFINLRAKSVGEVVDSKYRCNNEVEGKECGNIMENQINLTDIKPIRDKEVSPDIQLTDKVSIRMKYPEFGMVKDSLKIEDIAEITFNMIANSIESIYDGEQFHYPAEAAEGEMIEFVETMNQQQFEKVEEFFNNLPKLKTNVKMTCSKCGFNHDIPVEGLESFFV